jgi:hypothetical protein
MSAPKVVEIRDFEKARDLFEYFLPTKSEYMGPRPERLLYRGHGSAAWKLIPTAQEEISKTGYWVSP